MLEPTKRHRINKQRPYAITKKKDEPMAYDEAMTLMLRGRERYAVMLRGLRNREGLSQRELGEMIGVAQANISLMESGKRPIGKTVAQRIGKVFHTDYRLFL